jgi:large subunit ribosomal protein L18
MQNLKTIRKKNPTAAKRIKRAMGIRKSISGNGARPRLSVYRSAKHVYVQAIDDSTGVTVATASTMDKSLRDTLSGLNKSERAEKVGALVAKRLLEKGVEKAIFDRNGFRYHGRIAAIAKGAREAGMNF